MRNERLRWENAGMFGEKQAEAIIGPYSAPLAPRGCSRRVSHLPATQVYITVKMKTKKIHSSRDDGFYFNSRHQLGHISISGKNNHSWIWFFLTLDSLPSWGRGWR